MEKLKQKLQSRKFWFATITYIIALIELFWGETQADQIGAILVLILDTAVYIFGESYIDANRENK